MDTMPDFVDYMIIVNDGSKDETKSRIEEKALCDSRIVLLNHEVNKGLGQTLIDGYIKSVEMNIDVVAVMAGDAQMDPDDLESVVMPIVKSEADYVKGSRLLVNGVKEKMPKYRFVGNNILTLLTKFATGYWHVIDPQCGYTAISHEAISEIPIEGMIKGYGYNAHILYMLNMSNFTVKDVKVRPVYGEEKSKIKLGRYIRRVSALLCKLFFSRILKKYMLIDFNPAAMFYLLAFLCLPLAVIFGIRMLVIFITTLLMGIQSLFFAMWMDMEDNRRLRA